MPKGFYLFLITILLFSVNSSYAKESENENAPTDLKSEIKAYILHHLEDTHDFNLLSYTDDTSGEKVYVGMPLPVILWDVQAKETGGAQARRKLWRKAPRKPL